ncbi:MAG: NAD(P)-binding domain-containing protein [Planctomycetota bacterium]
MSRRIAMIGAGSVGFSLAIARELVDSEILNDATFVLMDIDPERLRESESRLRAFAASKGSPLRIEATTDRRAALAGADFVVTSYAPHRYEFWLRDIEIAARHGVHLLQGENGGPAGCIHALRNITIMIDIVRDLQDLAPDAWIMNFTNPMSMLCTYLQRYASYRAIGFCHQVHGSMGVVAEMLGFEPGDLQVISAGINHMNFLLDIRKRDTGESFMDAFLDASRQSPYWRKVHEYMPEQVFTLEFLNAFGVYPVGYDSHICEYLPFFYAKEEWERLGYESASQRIAEYLRTERKKTGATGTIDDVEVQRILGKGKFPFPKDPAGPYYRESPVAVMHALLTSRPTSFDAMVIPNEGAVSNLPYDAVVDVPAVVAGGRPRSVAVGPLPFVPAELCRRQIAIHELIAQAAATGDRTLFLEALCLDPFVRGLSTARKLVNDYLEEYRDYLPQFHR